MTANGTISSDACIVIGPDGTVLAATGGLLHETVGSNLEDRDELPRAVRDAGSALVEEVRGASGGAARKTIDLADGGTVELLAVEAIAVRRSVVDLAALLKAKLAVLTDQATELGVTLHVEVEPQVPRAMRLDSEKIAWLVTTLVGNALRYVHAGSRRLGSGTIELRARYDGTASTVTMEVRDDGPGIPADTIARLFRRDGLEVRGAGLALLLIRDIVAAHGGQVEVQSSTDLGTHGTLIRLTFPVPPRLS